MLSPTVCANSAPPPMPPTQVKLREMTILDLQKKISESDARLKQQQHLYEAVGGDLCHAEPSPSEIPALDAVALTCGMRRRQYRSLVSRCRPVPCRRRLTSAASAAARTCRAFRSTLQCCCSTTYVIPPIPWL